MVYICINENGNETKTTVHFNLKQYAQKLLASPPVLEFMIKMSSLSADFDFNWM